MSGERDQSFSNIDKRFVAWEALEQANKDIRDFSSNSPQEALRVGMNLLARRYHSILAGYDMIRRFPTEGLLAELTQNQEKRKRYQLQIKGMLEILIDAQNGNFRSLQEYLARESEELTSQRDFALRDGMLRVAPLIPETGEPLQPIPAPWEV